MKRSVVFIILCIVFMKLSGYAQSPEMFNYQAVLRNSSGEIIVGQSVEVQISIIDNNIGGDVLFTETHTKTTNAYGLVNLVIGTGTGVDDFSAINWAINSKFIRVKVDGTDMGTFQLLSVPFAMHASSATNLGSENVYTGTDTLFVVKDAEGNPVFVVFPDGVKVIVEETTKGAVGGFAVSGRSPTKTESDIFRVTPDSTRIFVNDTIQSKGRVGGFAVSGRSPTKGITREYLIVTQDSTRIYISDTSLAKGRVGGFAVSGRSPTKSEVKDYFNISGSKSVDTVNSEPRIYWYPKKEAFLTGRVLVESPDSVGTNSMATGFNSKAVGNFSQAMGYKSISRGAYSTAIGYQALSNDSNSFAFGNYAEARGLNSFALGDSAIVTGEDAYAIGAYAYASGLGSVAIGSKNKTFSDNFELRTTATGEFSLAVGFDADASGDKSVAIGNGVSAIGENSVAIGRQASATGEYSTALSYGTANGTQSVAMGGGTTSGDFALAQGLSSEAGGANSVALGYSCEASAEKSLALGSEGIATGVYSMAIGNNVTAQSYNSFVTGYYNVVEGNTSIPLDADPLFVIGNGTWLTGSNAVKVLKNGKTAIGNITPLARLHVASASSEHGLRVDVNGSMKFQVNANGGTSIGSTITPSANGLYVSGSTGMGVFSPTQKLDVNGNARFRSIGSSAGSALYVTSDGTLSTASSDIRLKENISTLENSLQKVQSLRGVNFTWKSEPEMGNRIGFIAQEVEKVIPELVFTNEIDGYKGVNYAEMSAVLVEAVKELKTENDTLKKQLLELNQKLEKIEQMLENK